jgi:hypothetical protein
MTTFPVKTHRPDNLGSTAARRSLTVLWWIPLSPIVGFAAAGLFLAESWPLWQVIPLAIVLAAPFAAGAFYGLQAVRHGDRRGWIGLVLHTAFALLAIAMPISESLTV